MSESFEDSRLPITSGEFWRVAVEAPLPSPLTYRMPSELRGDPRVQRGQCVSIPLGRRKVSGVLLGPAESTGEFQLKEVLAIEQNRPRLPESFLQWLEWLAKYYEYPIGQVVELAFPPLAKAMSKRNVERKSKAHPIVPNAGHGTLADARPKPTSEQEKVLADIRATPGFCTHLVHGVTGSGKTEIYMRLMEDIVKSDRQGLVLVPEISLTPQLIDRFSRRLGDAVAVIHSHLTQREKTNQWWAMLEGGKQVLIGARSALFCPLPKLGLIIVDEEHEASFKQDEKLKYHARDAAVMLARYANCPIVLGSATPSLESWHNAKSGRYRLHQLKSRVADRALPTIDVVDMRDVRDKRRQDSRGTELPFWLSDQLYGAVTDTLARGEQAALFLNRRGVAQAVLCPDCGFVPECPNCAVKLTLHGRSHLLCHYCDYHETLTEHCPECKEGEPKPLGLGTEMLERDVAKLFPSARLARMDRDEIASREDLERTIRAVENRDVDLLIGTQMLAKGLDFPGLTLVGLVMADVAFNLPDFRSSERSFQLLTQVSGRSGRHLDEGAGRVVLQTYNPDHPSITYTCAHDYEGFAAFELMFRETLGYPPYRRLASFRIHGLDLGKVQTTSRELRRRAEHLARATEVFSGVEMLGPAEAPLAKLRNQHRWQLLVKAPTAASLGAFCRTLMLNRSWVGPGVKVAVDIDAIHML